VNINKAMIEAKVIEIFSISAKSQISDIDIVNTIRHYDLDSLEILVFRESLERLFQIHISDNDWINLFTIKDIITFVHDRKDDLVSNASKQISTHHIVHQTKSDESYSGQRYSNGGILYADIEIGMPMLGRNNMAEGPLLQTLGDLRWRHISHLCSVPSKYIIDTEGNRLYSTFFYVEMSFPPNRPLASYGENDRFKVASGLKRFGTSMLDGTFFLFPEDYEESENFPFERVEDATIAEIPAIRLSNIFVMQFSGAEWLKKSRPANPGFDSIPELAQAPDSYILVKQAEKDGCFGSPPAFYVPMTKGPINADYKLVPDRDLNGAGLVYFANYPLFLDICEREVLSSAVLNLTDELLDRRTLIHRRSAYLNNAAAYDKLLIEVEPWVENPFAKGGVAPEIAPINLWINFKMYRQSDGRLMMISTVEKTIFSRAIEDVPFFSKLASM